MKASFASLLKKGLAPSAAIGALAAGMLLATAPAKADLVTTFVSESAGGGTFNYTYSLALKPGETLTSGSFGSIIDFGPVVGTITNNLTAGFSITTPLTSPALPSPFPSPTDNASLANILYTYTGSNIVNADGTDIQLGTFIVSSTFGPGGSLTSDGSAQANAGGPQANLNLVAGPNVVPLPGALPLFATGLAGLGLLGFRRKQKRASV